MRKYILTLLTIFLLSNCTTVFAGRNVITYYKGTIQSIVLTHEDGTNYTVVTGPIDFNHTSTFNLPVEVGPGKTIPYGTYTNITYVFKNEFEFSGYVELTNRTDAAENGRYNTNSISPLVFEKDGPLNVLTYIYPEGNHDWDWCTAIADDATQTLAVTEKDFVPITITEESGKLLNVTVVLEYLWFGHSWPNFDDNAYVNKGASEEFTLVGTTLTPPMIDPPEVEVIR